MPVTKSKTKPLFGQPSSELAAALARLGSGGKRVMSTFDLPVAGNIIEWVTGSQFLDFPQAYDHYGQFGLFLEIEQILCPICNPYRPHQTGIQYVWGMSKSDMQKLVLLRRNHGQYTCPGCKSTQADLRSEGLLKDYNSILVMTGMRSGKSASAGLYATWVEHVLATDGTFTRDALANLLHQAPGTSFEVAFVATTSEQTEKTTFDYFRNFRERSPWVQKYVARVKELERAQPRTGIQPWKYSEADKEVYNGLLGVKFVSLHSNSAGMAGATRIASFVDELARFDTSESKRGADEVWRVLSASLKTVRTAAVVHSLQKTVYGLRLATSSPISVDDKMYVMTTKAVSNEELDHVLALKLATWEFNNFQPRSMFNEEYAEDPVQAERDFGANPPLTETPFIDDIPRFVKSIEYGLSPSVHFETTYPVDTLGREYIGTKATDSIMSPEVPRYICFDAGATFDAFSGCCARPGWVDVLPPKDDEDQRPRRILLVIYDWVVRILPSNKPKRTVWFDCVEEIIRDLQNNFRIVQVGFDQWNSISLVQGIRNLGVPAEDAVHVTADDFKAFKADCYGGRVKLLPPTPEDKMTFTETGQLMLGTEPPKLSPAAAGIYELVKLSRSDDLKKIFNPNKGKKRGYDSDDTARVLVAAHKAIQAAMADDQTEHGVKARLKREQAGGEMWGGGSVVQGTKGWSQGMPGAGTSVRPQMPYGEGMPGYGAGDTWVDPKTGKESSSHAFGPRRVVTRKF